MRRRPRRGAVSIRPIVVVSKCLDLDACRYNGQFIRVPFIRALQRHVEIRPVCPEVEIGLGTPRDPIRIVVVGKTRHLVQPATGRDVTGIMEKFTRTFLDGIGEVDGFILKSSMIPESRLEAEADQFVGQAGQLPAGLRLWTATEKAPNSNLETLLPHPPSQHLEIKPGISCPVRRFKLQLADLGQAVEQLRKPEKGLEQEATLQADLEHRGPQNRTFQETA